MNSLSNQNDYKSKQFGAELGQAQYEIGWLGKLMSFYNMAFFLFFFKVSLCDFILQ